MFGTRAPAQVELLVTARSGVRRNCRVPATGSLMETLRAEGFDVAGICGGAGSCGTCHVYVDPPWLPRLDAPRRDEATMLDAIGDFVEVRENSRLACRIALSARLSGLRVEVGPSV